MFSKEEIPEQFEENQCYFAWMILNTQLKALKIVFDICKEKLEIFLQ